MRFECVSDPTSCNGKRLIVYTDGYKNIAPIQTVETHSKLLKGSISKTSDARLISRRITVILYA